jgi:hypothetical protein
MKKRLFKIGVVVIFLALTAMGGLYILFPFGIRTCALPCMLSALNMYAAEHSGYFPGGGTNYFEDLRKLYPQYCEPRILAGISGNIRLAQKCLSAGEPLNANTTSWVYFPGLRDSDPPDVMIIYEQASGVLQNGRRTTKGTRVAGFVNGTWKRIPESDWDQFLAVQSARRSSILDARK